MVSGAISRISRSPAHPNRNCSGFRPSKHKAIEKENQRSEIICENLRIAECEAKQSHSACLMGRGYFFGARRNCRRSAKDCERSSHRAPRVPSAAAREESCSGAIQRAGRFICALSGAYAGSYCSGLAVHVAGPVAVQFNHSCPSSALASLVRPSFCRLRICDWNLGVGNEFWDASDRRRQSSCRDHAVRIILFAGAVPGILAYPATRSCATPRVDDSDILNWAGGRYDPADYGDIFRD